MNARTTLKLFEVGRGEQGITNLRSIRTLGSDEGDAYVARCKRLFDFERSRDLLVFVTDSLDAFRSRVAEHKEQKAAQKLGALNQDPRPRRILQRHAVDFLNTMRLYLDHRRTHFARKHGASSFVLEAFKDACKAIHDREPVYRFAYELRNFVQHCGMPLQSLRANQRVEEVADDKRIVTDVFVGFNRDELLREFDWRHGRAFIEAQPEEFDAVGVFERTEDLLWEIEEASMGALLPEIWLDAREVARLLREASSEQGFGIVAEFIPKDAERKSTTLTLRAPPMSILTWLKFVTQLQSAPGLKFNDEILALNHPPSLAPRK